MADRLFAVGGHAPDFSLEMQPGKMFTLSQNLSKPTVLVFYPADWSPVCGDQLGVYNEILPEFQKYGAQIVGVSVDGPWCHAAYSKARELEFTLLSDFEP